MLGLFNSRRPTALPVEATSLSETGLVRPDNQDHVFVDAEARVFCVADGMGGGADGARASQIVCDHLRKAKLGAALRPPEDVRAAVDSAIAAAHAEIGEYARAHGFDQMGTTVALVILDALDPCRAQVCHVGDSRVYRLRGGMVRPLTRDHTVGFACAEFAGSDASAFRDRKNPLAHVLTRAVGVTEAPVRTEWSAVDVRAGDRFVICTDGVHDVVSDARLAVFAAGGTVASARDRLAREIVAKGAPDNYSFVLVQIGGTR